jgi:hypothetical protein
MGGEFDFFLKVHLHPPSFLSIRKLIPVIFKNLIWVPIFIFLIFQFFFRGRREESPDSDVERESCCWWQFRPSKQLFFFFLSNSSLWWWEFILDFFSPRAIWAREDFGFQIDFEYWISCLHFWRSWIGLARFVACIISILGKKWLKMSLFFQKHPEPHYSSHYSGWILGILRRRVIYW